MTRRILASRHFVAALLAMVMRLAPNRPTYVEVDDLMGSERGAGPW